MENKVEVFLPKSYDLVVGDTFQLYYRGIIVASNPYCYSIVATCEKGKNFPRYFEYTPKEVGSHKLNISVYDANLNLLGSADTILNVVAPTPAKKIINVLCLGASTTAGGEWINEVNRRITAKDGEPKGLGFDGVNFVGNCKKGDVCFEAFGGWEWRNFTSSNEGAVWVEAPNTKTVEDQHSVWKDENGALWQLETLQVDYLKFNRYQYHDAPKLVSGTLYHVKNAVNQEPIKYYSSFSEKVSPFYDYQSKKLDFRKYLDKLGVNKLDIVYIYLGGNGLMRTEAQTFSRAEFCKIVVKEAKVLVDLILQDCPNVKIKLMSGAFPSLKGGLGSNYGSEEPFNNRLDLINYYTELGKAYESWCEEEKYKGNLEYINLSGQFDSEYNFPHIEKPVNVRSEKTEWFDVNGVHPAPCGYMQIADAVYRNLVKECFSEK